MTWFINQINRASDPKNLPVGARIYTLAFDFVFNFVSSSLCLIGLEALRRHEMQFINDDIYGPTPLLQPKNTRATDGNRSSQSSTRKLAIPTESAVQS
jgi:hypothetical protein